MTSRDIGHAGVYKLSKWKLRLAGTFLVSKLFSSISTTSFSSVFEEAMKANTTWQYYTFYNTHVYLDLYAWLTGYDFKKDKSLASKLKFVI